MNKIWIVFVVAVLLYMGANAWDDQWIGQDALRVFTCVLAMIMGLIVWSCLGTKNNDEENL